MEVSSSSFYDWLSTPDSVRTKQNIELCKKVSTIFDKSKGSYGRRRIAAVLEKDDEMKASINRVHRRMKELNICGYRPPSFKRTTIGDPLLEDSPNLIKDAVINGINKIWVSDITYIATKEGWLYLCTIMDLFSRKIVGWSTRSDMTVGIVLDAFTMAHTQRKPHQKVIFHSDKGEQYKAKKFRRKLSLLNFSDTFST